MISQLLLSSPTSADHGLSCVSVIDMTLVKGTALQVQAFRTGFSTIFPVRDLLAFSADELVILFGSAEEDWGADSAYLTDRHSSLIVR